MIYKPSGSDIKKCLKREIYKSKIAIGLIMIAYFRPMPKLEIIKILKLADKYEDLYLKTKKYRIQNELDLNYMFFYREYENSWDYKDINRKLFR